MNWPSQGAFEEIIVNQDPATPEGIAHKARGREGQGAVPVSLDQGASGHKELLLTQMQSPVATAAGPCPPLTLLLL